MLSDYAKNEIAMSCDYICSHSLLPAKGAVINIIGNHVLCDYIKDTLSALNEKTEYRYTVYQSDNSDALSSTVCKQCFLYCLDARKNDSYNIVDITKALSYAAKIKNSVFVAMIIVPPLTKNEKVMSLSEMELSCNDTNGFLTEVERTLHAFCNKTTVKEVRFDNFLTEDSSYSALNIPKLVDNTINAGTVVINKSDAFDIFSAISLSDAVDAVFTVLKCGKHGNIYNASGYPMSVYECKSFIYQTLCEHGINMDFNNDDAPCSKQYRVLNCGKLNSLGYQNMCGLDEQLLYAISGILPKKYNVIKDKIDSLYDGKLNDIRKIELDLLQEVDSLCRKNNIKYFLSGGSMLGAVRHKGFIPWDDDIDIAMLRDDFEKFRKICKNELPSKYRYQSFENKDGYHYFFDKITVNNTYFSTKYSDKYDMQKGISMDIFVFDKTSENRFFQKLHFKTLMAFRLMMNVRWINRPRKGKSYLLSKLALPILRVFSMDTYSKIYDKILRRYEHSKSSTVLPPATDHVDRGVMPKKWFDNVVDATFDGVVSCIPTGYDEYLKIWYGEDYMSLLPLYKQVVTHDFYRLDLGDNLTVSNIDNQTQNTTFNYKGELL